ncbi:hypothetical protein [Owenweeksia hongkongensis]|uniref:hypothetical protein n=1 Tax=Owenweeksia hongkongensis TaxID=253245 RepID=UPI003A942506
MKSTNQINYSLGATFSGSPFWFGILLSVLVVIAFLNLENLFIRYLISAVLVIPAIGLLLSIQEIVIDGGNKCLNTFFKFGPLKIKLNQRNLKECDKVILELFTENQTMNMKSISTSVRTRSYDIYAEGETHKTLLVEITDYQKAKQFGKEVSNILQIPFEDSYQNLRETAKKIRSRRKR